MLLLDLLKDIDVKNLSNVQNININGIQINSKKVKQGDLFVCLNGTRVDGHNFIYEAKQNGAIAFVVEKVDKKFDGIQILVNDSKKALSYLAKNFFVHNQMPTMIGITGTNGKTTTTYMVASILKQAGKKVGVIGTQGAVFYDYKQNYNMTTPDPIELFKTINDMKELGAEYIVMEVSAHAIQLKKIDAIPFTVKAITNISQDHLDFFKSLKKYARCKLGFMSCGDGKKVVNIDDKFSKLLLKKIDALSFSTNTTADIYSFSENLEKNEYSVNLMGELIEINSNTYGKYNMSNALCAIAICYLLDINPQDMANGINNFVAVDGRFNVIIKNGIKFVVDFAHTPDAFNNVIPVAREMTKGKLFVVFGCGGDRDKNKRPKMGRIASKLCDYVILTEDNPRSEKIEDICEDISRGIKNDNYTIIPNRKEAIYKAYSMAKNDDTILVLGKGAEDYIEKGGKKYPYLDKTVISELN